MEGGAITEYTLKSPSMRQVKSCPNLRKQVENFCFLGMLKKSLTNCIYRARRIRSCSLLDNGVTVDRIWTCYAWTQSAKIQMLRATKHNRRSSFRIIRTYKYYPRILTLNWLCVHHPKFHLATKINTVISFYLLLQNWQQQIFPNPRET